MHNLPPVILAAQEHGFGSDGIDRAVFVRAHRLALGRDRGQITFRSTGPMGDGLCGRLRKGRVRREMIARIFRLAAFGAAAFEYQDVIGEQGQSIDRSEEHTSELQSLMRISYAVFCLKKKTY